MRYAPNSVSWMQSRCVLFFNLLRTIREGYPTLFGGGDGEDEMGEGQEAEGASEDADEDNGFNGKWGWVANIDAVAELTHDSWDAVTALPAKEFLNILCYRADKLAEQERQRKEYLRKH